MFESFLNHAAAQSSRDGKSVIISDVDIWSILGICEVKEIFEVQFKMTINSRALNKIFSAIIQVNVVDLFHRIESKVSFSSDGCE